MLISKLGEIIDSLAKENSACILESTTTVVISDLTFPSVECIISACSDLKWKWTLFDGADEQCFIADIDNDLGPFRVALDKPDAPAGTLQILTATGLTKFLITGSTSVKWWVAGLSERIETRSNVLCPWGDSFFFELLPETKNPRALVKEYTTERTVPSNIGLWLLRDPNITFTYSKIFSTWLNASIRAISRSLANEIDPESGALKFNGNPKASINYPSDKDDLSIYFDKENFKELQIAAIWVYENPRETESKHTLLATEIARISNIHNEFSDCLGIQISSSLDSARIAYQMMMSDLSRDTLKSLGDLRKSITEETAKVTDAMRQLVGGVSAALAVGFGLLATRMTTNTSPWLIIAVTFVVLTYVLSIIFSGVQFVRIQRQLRKDWQSKLYRFLPDADYKKMVSDPTSKSESTFMIGAIISSLAIIALTVVVLYLSFHEKTPTANSDQSTSNIIISKEITSSSATIASTPSSDKVNSNKPIKYNITNKSKPTPEKPPKPAQ